MPILELQCTQCAAPLKISAIDRATRRASCEYCAHTFDAEPMLGVVQKAAPQELTELNALEQRIYFRAVVFTRAGWWLAFALVLGTVFIYFHPGSWGNEVLTPVGIAHLFAALGVGLFALRLTIRKPRVRVDRSWEA